MTAPRFRSMAVFPIGGLLVMLFFLCGPVANAATRSFVARVDRSEVPVDDTLIFEVTLVLDGGNATGYRPPSFKNLRILSERPSQSHQFRMGAGGASQQTVYTWTYELAPQELGVVTIGAAQIRVDGVTAKTSPVTVKVVDAAGVKRKAPAPQASFPGSAFGGAPPRAAATTGSGQNTVRVHVNKERVYVGEQVTVEWRLFLAERQDKYQPVREPRTDGFWVEDLPIAANARGLSLTQQEHQGQMYLVAPLFRKALFPLRAGELTVTPFEAEVSQVDFFGTTLRTERLKTDPLKIEVLPLPVQGKPAGFDGAAVGRFQIEAHLDRSRVAVGEAVSLTVTMSGEGNVRKLPVPDLTTRKLFGVKVYDPKVAVDVTTEDPVVGRMKIEYLLLPERPGTINLEPFRLAYFDPGSRGYKTVESDPLTLEVIQDAGDTVPPTAMVPGTPSSSEVQRPATDNVLGIELRPIRSRHSLRRDLGTTLYRSSAFGYLLLVPPVLLFGTIVWGRLRAQLGRETERGKNRRMKRLLRQRLGQAERHLRAGQSAAFFIEIDRAVRDVLTARLSRTVSGLARDELMGVLQQDGLPDDLCNDIMDTLESCDQARFAPGGVGDQEMNSALAKSEELLVRIERLRKPPTGERERQNPS